MGQTNQKSIFKTKNMKNLQHLFLIVTIVSIFGCSEDESSTTYEYNYYRVLSFETAANSKIDLNNDGVSNSNILNELTNYSTYPYDLVMKSLNNQKLYSFYLPNQNIQYDLNSCPSGFVEFARNGFIITLDNDIFSTENMEIDSDNYLIYFTEQNNNQMKIILRKKYFDFNDNSSKNIEFEITYVKTN